MTKCLVFLFLRKEPAGDKTTCGTFGRVPVSETRGVENIGSLVPRGRPGAFIHDPEEAAARMVRLVKEGVVTAADGSELRLKAHSICVHGDNPDAVGMARTVRATFDLDSDLLVVFFLFRGDPRLDCGKIGGIGVVNAGAQ